MESIQKPFVLPQWRSTTLAVLIVAATSFGNANAQVRVKKPDRGVYQPRTLQRTETARESDESNVGSLSELIREENDLGLRAAPQPSRNPSNAVQAREAKWGAPLVDTEMTDADSLVEAPRRKPRSPVAAVAAQRPRPKSQPKISQTSPAVRLVLPHRPQQRNQIVSTGAEVWSEEAGEVYFAPHGHGDAIDGTCDGCDGTCDGCDGGCDSIGCNQTSLLGRRNAFLSFEPDRWFASAELMLMFRNGDGIPPLVTTGSSNDSDTAGELGQAATQVVVGNESIFDDLTAGGRFTLGTWLDCQQRRSLMLRGWFAGEESFRFAGNQDSFPVLARPFLNVTDGQTAEQDTQLVAFPNRATGSITINGDSNVYGADISIRQFWRGRYGFNTDLLYGYQYTGLDENLAINATSTSLDEDFAPVGSVISVLDSFDIENEFHGAQLGLASSYREGCWSFRSLMKLGFGSLRRSGNLFGQTTTSVDAATAIDPNGLLVRDTNDGRRSDSTFAWSPELDFTLGWQRYPCFDLTFGYHFIALTDALQVSGAIDPALSANLADPPVDNQRPLAAFRYDTYYVQGIHFGLQYIY